MVYHINRLLSLHVDGTLDGLRKALGDGDDDKPLSPQDLERALASDAAALVPKCHSAALLSLVFVRGAAARTSSSQPLLLTPDRPRLAQLLKRHLKRQYQLNDLRCQGFDPSDTGPGRPVSRLSDGMVMNYSQTPTNG